MYNDSKHMINESLKILFDPRFVQKVLELDPTSKEIPWTSRPYKRKHKQMVATCILSFLHHIQVEKQCVDILTVASSKPYSCIIVFLIFASQKSLQIQINTSNKHLPRC